MQKVAVSYLKRVSIFILLDSIVPFSIYGMQLIDFYKIYPFPQDEIYIGHTFYHSLKNKPLQSDVTFLAIPWNELFAQKKIPWLFSQNINKKHKYSFTVAPNHVNVLSYIKKIGISVVFTPHALPGESTSSMQVVPIPMIPYQGVDPSKEKDILVSFVGSATHPIRKEIFNIKRQPGICIIKRAQFNYFIKDLHKRKQEQEEYKNILARSRYSLCPRGVYPGSIRFWESLQAGAIPILIEDPILLPEGIDWEACILRVSRKNLPKIYEILSAISQEEENKKRKNCINAYKLLCKDDLAYSIRRFYGEA